MKLLNIGNRILNNYLIETDKGYVVIDTGYAGKYPRFLKGLENKGVNKTDIKYIFITHVHDDHVGFLNELRNDTNATIIMHNESPERLLAGHNKLIGGCPNRLAEVFVESMNLIGKGEHRFPVVKIDDTDDVVLWDEGNQYFKQLGIGLEIIALPGHTSDSIGLLTDDGFLFCGDACMNNFPSIKRDIIWIENLEEYKESWYKMIGSPAKVIYPSHGSPFPKEDLIKYSNHLNKLKLHRTSLSSIR